jgi:lipoprotein NlpI
MAVRDYTQALAVRSDYARASANRGVALFYRGDFPGALSDFNSALRIDPRGDLALHNRGIVRYVLGDRRGALSDFNAAIALDPGNPYPRIWRLAVATEESVTMSSAYRAEESARYARPSPSWPGALMRGFLGLTAEAELLRIASTEKDARLAGQRRAEALYYLGLRKKTMEKKSEPAMDYFKRSLAEDTSVTHARRLARFEVSGD